MADSSNTTTGSTLPRRQLGRYLTDWRNRSGLSQSKAAQLLEIGVASVNRLEHGQNSRVKTRDVQAVCDLYGVPPDLTVALIGLARQANVKSWWHQYGALIPKDFDFYVGLEAAARKITTYQSDLIPGLLQTAEYERARVHFVWPDATEEDVDKRVQLRMHRQHIITRKTQPVVLDAVVGEAALHRMSGSHGVMAAALFHLAHMSTRENISVRILPFSAGYPGGLSMSPFVKLDFGETSFGGATEPPVIYLEGSVGSMYLEEEEDVRFYDRAFESLREASLSPVASRDLLRRVAKEHEQREH